MPHGTDAVMLFAAAYLTGGTLYTLHCVKHVLTSGEVPPASKAFTDIRDNVFALPAKMMSLLAA